MLNFSCSGRQWKELESLAYWIADLSYITERFGKDDPEISTCRKTLEKCIFPVLDKLHVPFWVQNDVICWAEEWRNYKAQYMRDVLAKKGITRC